MWIPKNPPGGWPVKVLVGLGSLALVHAVFIGGHHVLDDTSPTSWFYPLDRAVESVEIQWARLWGAEATIETRMHSAQERVHEAEVMVDEVEQGNMTHDDIVEIMESLFNDAAVQSDMAVHMTQDKMQEFENDVSDFSLAIFVQSSLEDMMLRVSNILQTVHEHELLTQMSENFLATTQSLLDTSDAMVDAFDVSDDVRLTIRDQVRQKILSGEAANIIPKAMDIEAACSLDGQSCDTTADCCTEQGLTCMPFQSSNGFTRRCQRTVHDICMTECITTGSVTTWSEARRCRSGYIEAGMQPCPALVREACATVSERQACWRR